jgi:hypothetical protein
MGRTWWAILLNAAILAASLSAVRRSSAELVPVPIEWQAELLAKAVIYDRNMPARAGDRLQVLLLTNERDPESIGVAKRMQAALQSIPRIAGLSHDERLAAFTSGLDLIRQCRSQRVAIVFVSLGLGDQVPAIRQALDGIDVLTVAAVPEYVELGVILGFDVLSGKPKLLVHLTQARRQNVDLRAEFLKLARVFE